MRNTRLYEDEREFEKVKQRLMLEEQEQESGVKKPLWRRMKTTGRTLFRQAAISLKSKATIQRLGTMRFGRSSDSYLGKSSTIRLDDSREQRKSSYLDHSMDKQSSLDEVSVDGSPTHSFSKSPAHSFSKSPTVSFMKSSNFAPNTGSPSRLLHGSSKPSLYSLKKQTTQS